MKRRPTIMLFALSILYGWAIFFLTGIVLRLVINFFYVKELFPEEQDVFKTGVMSLIAAVAGGAGSWIFAKIDECKARKSPPSDS